MKKQVSLLLATAMMATTLTACGGSSSQQAAAPAETKTEAKAEAAAPAASSGEKVTIKFVNGFTGGDGEFMTKIVDGFNESQDQYFVDQLITDDHYTKFKSDKFDLVIMHADWLSTYIPDGLIRTVDDLYEKAGLSIDDFADVTKTYAQQDGKLWAFPLDNFGYVMFYNKKYVETPPATYDEMKELAAKLDSANTNVWAFGLPLAGEHQWTLISTLAQYDVDYVGEDHMVFDTPEAAEALMHINDWIFKDGLSPANLGIDDHCNLFITTADANTMQTACSLTGPWDYTAFKAVLGDDLGVAPIPTFGSHHAVNGSGHNFAVSSACDDEAVLDGIAAFMNYVYTPDVLLNWADSGQAPNHKATMEVIQQNADKYPVACNTYDVINDIAVLPTLYNVRSQPDILKENVWTELITNENLTAADLMPLLEKATKYAAEMAEQ